jgi:hypothetical protein
LQDFRVTGKRFVGSSKQRLVAPQHLNEINLLVNNIFNLPSSPYLRSHGAMNGHKITSKTRNTLKVKGTENTCFDKQMIEKRDRHLKPFKGVVVGDFSSFHCSIHSHFNCFIHHQNHNHVRGKIVNRVS